MPCHLPTGRQPALWALFAVLISALPSLAEPGRFDDLLRRLPEDPNALFVIDVENLLKTGLAKSENWTQRIGDAFEATPLILPPTATRFVLAADFDIQFMHPVWEAAVMEVSEDRTVMEIAARQDGTTDTLAGYQAAWIPAGCVIKFAPNILGLLSPARRQATIRWLDDIRQRQTPAMSLYLQQVAERVSAGTEQVGMAIEMANVVSPAEIKEKVAENELFDDLDRSRVAEILTSLQGISLLMAVDDRAEGSLSVDFGLEADILAPVAKPLLLGALSQAGAHLDEFESWTSTVEGTRVTLSGELTESGRQRIFSLLSLDSSTDQAAPTAPTKPPKAAPDAGRPPADDLPAGVGHASRRYFRAINKFLEDVQQPTKNTTISQVALWMDNYARKIDRLSTRNLDPEVADYGKLVADALRQAVGLVHGMYSNIEYRNSQTIRGTRMTVAAVPTWNTVNYGGFRRYREYAPFASANIDIGNMIADRRQISEEEYTSAKEQAQELLQRVQQEAARVRSEMSAKYGLEF